MPAPLTLRLAVVRNVSKTFIECEYISKTGEKSFQCPIPHPYVGNGGGIMVGIEKNAIVLVGSGTAERKFVVGFIPIRQQYFDQENIQDISWYNTQFPDLDEGQIVLKSPVSNSYIDMDSDGNILIDADIGDSNADLELSKDTRTLYHRVDNLYSFTEAGRHIDGIVKRDKHVEESKLDTSSIDFLSGTSSDVFLEKIGRSPKNEVQDRTTSLTRSFVRNPALVERRSITYEYGDSFNVNYFSKEVAAMESGNSAIKTNGTRQDRRTDVLNLNLLNYNHLIEKVEGTVVDIYGNILDINRNIIPIPDYDSLEIEKNIDDNMQKIYAYMRRSIKYHFEINSRKDLTGDEPSRDSGNTDSRKHSRWSIDVDGEGLTKINIPSSSNTGNIPVLGRYLTTRDEDNKESGSFRNVQENGSIDVKLLSFSAGGPSLSNSAYVPETVGSGTISAGTAYHDLTQVADSLWQNGKWGTGNRMSSSINNAIGDSNANAGGRSLQASLDGSAEISIGKDNIDKKSLLLDLEGGMISHYGADSNGRSIIHQSDGSVLIQIGSTSPGRLEIHCGTQKIIIDESGMTIDVIGNMVLNATGSVGISAGANLLLHGAIVSAYGRADATAQGSRTVGQGQTTILPTGMPQTVM